MNPFNQFGKGKPKEEEQRSKNAVIYTRVSTKEQMDKNHSLETQKKFCNEYAARNGLTVMSYFGGTYESAQTDERNEFNRMMRFVNRSSEKISCILVYTLDRFSRSGENAIYISSELKKRGISIVAVTQPIDTSSHSGMLQQNIQFIFSKYDNDIRRQKAIDGMRERIRRGEWMGTVPPGYARIKENGTERIEINAKGELIKQAFIWKARDGYTNTQIVKKLRALGLDLKHRQAVTKIFRNPFYCGMIAHKMLDGEVIEGKQPAIVSRDLFLKVNNIQKENNRHGYRMKKQDENLPLKQFVKCETCSTPFTGYIAKKRIYYYKCNRIGCQCNRGAEYMHASFKSLLSQYSLKASVSRIAHKTLIATYDYITEHTYERRKPIEMKIAEIREKLEKMEERYAFGEMEKAIFDKFSGRLKEDLEILNKELFENTRGRLSNASEYINYSVKIALELPKIWDSGSFENKTALQNAVFPKGIYYSKKNDHYRTPEVSTLFELNPRFTNGFNPNKKGLSEMIFPKVPLSAGGGTRTPMP